MKLFNTFFRWYIKQRLPRIERYEQYPIEVQNLLFQELIAIGSKTIYGKQYNFQDLKTPAEYRQQVPITYYEDLLPYIQRMMHGEPNVLWTGIVHQFSKSSGTTGGGSKFIPVTEVNLRQCHLGGPHDVMAKWYQNNDARIFEGKSLIMGGTFETFAPHPDTQIGDVSAIIIDNMPSYAKRFVTPDIATSLIKNFDEKIERMAKITPKENVTSITGVPTWTIVLFRRILEITGKRNMLEVWPNFQLYVHGGVNFAPYRQQFQAFFPGSQVGYLNGYNASEGFFAAQLQNEANDGEMTLLLDNGVYFEFLPSSEWHKEKPDAIGLNEVQLGENYAIVISTNSGLWRYVPGDTVMFTSLFPMKIKITGRTKHFINAFGEEVVVENTDAALAKTCATTNAQIREYTVAPIPLTQTARGGHEWLIEFDRLPESLPQFTALLDQNLQEINTDYAAKRYKNMALTLPKIHPMSSGTFHNWLRSRGKYGGQNKIPRLSNNRKYLEEILAFDKNTGGV